MTMRTPYSVVSAMTEMSIDVGDTPGETLADVFSTPNTDQGCRPISVKIQQASCR